MAITELPRDLGQGAVVEEDGTKSFVAPVQGWGGMSEEVVAEGVIHGGTSAIVMDFLGESLCRGKAIAGGVGKSRPGQGVRKRRNSRGKRQKREIVDPSRPGEIRREDPVKSVRI